MRQLVICTPDYHDLDFFHPPLLRSICFPSLEPIMKDATERLIPDSRWDICMQSLSESRAATAMRQWHARLVMSIVLCLFMALAIFLRTQRGW
jgi:hypothetical protein